MFLIFVSEFSLYYYHYFKVWGVILVLVFPVTVLYMVQDVLMYYLPDVLRNTDLDFFYQRLTFLEICVTENLDEFKDREETL